MSAAPIVGGCCRPPHALLDADHGVRLVYKELPILGPPSVLAARALLAAQKQGGYARLQQSLMTGPPQITTDLVRTDAVADGLDWPRLQHDMADPAVQATIEANLHMARQLGIDGTPAFVIGDRLLPGAVELADLQRDVTAARPTR